jgi:outer membrane receptor protein involved in Fe transport
LTSRTYAAAAAAFLSILTFSTAQAQLPGAAPVRPGGVQQNPTAIVGTVQDSANRPLSGAAITIRAGGDSSLVTGTLTDQAGKFRIEGLSNGMYHVRVSYLGFKGFERDVTLAPQSLIANMGTLKLATDVIAVEGVTAEGIRSAVTVGVDRNVYTTKNMPAASSGTTTDLLRNVPELDVDVDGNVKLQGSQSVALHINGRPAPMRGDALKNFLQMMPANRVERVEIVPNPSAKYDPEGIAGIVNIVLKDNLDLGTSGSFGMNVDSRGRHGTNGSLNYQKGKLTLFGNAAVHLNRSSMRMQDLRQNLLVTPNTFFQMNANNEQSGYFTFFDGSAEYKLGKLETLYASARGNVASNEMDGIQQFALLDAIRTATSRWNFDNNNEFSWGNTDASLGLRRIVKPQQHELTLELRRNGNHQGQEQNYVRNFLTPLGDPTTTPNEIGITDNVTDVAEYSAKADYMRPLTAKLKLDAGYKGAFKATDYDNELRRYSGTSTTPFQTQGSIYDYAENYHQAYALLTRQFGKVGVQAGARAEIANTEFSLPTGDNFDNEYNNLFPSLNISYSAGTSFSSRFSYSKRVERPQPNMLNPGTPSADSLNKFVGNPQLRPKYTHSFTMDFTRMGAWGMIKLAPYYRETVDNWEYFKVVDNTGVATLTWQNTASVKAMGTNATLSLRKGSTANGFLSFNAYKYERDASNISAAYSGDGFRWDVSGNAMMTVRPGTMVQGFARYQAPQDMPQGRISSSVFSNIGVRHQFMENKASLNLAVVDPFDLFRFRFETNDLTHVQQSENKVSIRSLRIALTYNFGKPPQPTRRPDQDQQQQPTDGGQPQIR